MTKLQATVSGLKDEIHVLTAKQGPPQVEAPKATKPKPPKKKRGGSQASAPPVVSHHMT